MGNSGLESSRERRPLGFWERRTLVRRCPLASGVKFLLLTLHEYAGDDAWAFPHQTRLMSDLGFSERVLRRHLQQARDGGLLTIERQRRGNRYRIEWEAVAVLAHAQEVTQSCSSDEPSELAGDSARNDRSHPARPAAETGRDRRLSPADWDGSDPAHVAGARRTLTEPSPERPKNTQSTGVPWKCGAEDPILPDEVQSLAQGERRFEALRKSGRLRDTDRLRFLTLWSYVGRRSRSDAGDDQIRNPGGFVAECVRRREWAGSRGDEDRIRQWDREQERPPPRLPCLTTTSTEAAPTPLPSLMEEFRARLAARRPTIPISITPLSQEPPHESLTRPAEDLPPEAAPDEVSHRTGGDHDRPASAGDPLEGTLESGPETLGPPLHASGME